MFPFRSLNVSHNNRTEDVSFKIPPSALPFIYLQKPIYDVWLFRNVIGNNFVHQIIWFSHKYYCYYSPNQNEEKKNRFSIKCMGLFI